MRILKKYIRKLYHLIWFLGAFILFSPHVYAAVNITPPMDRYATILLDGSTTYYNTSFWNVDDNFWSGGYIPQVTVPSSPSEPSSYAWIASGTSYCGTDGGNITGYIGSANGSFYNYLQKIEFHSDAGRVLCSFTNANNEGTLVQFNCTSSNLSNFSIHYKYKNVSGVTVGQYPILGRTMSVTCNTSDSSSAINNQTQQIIQNDNSNTQQIIQNDNSNNQQIIDNNNQNTQDIIDSSGSNTQSIIDNQNENSNKEIESQKVCKNINFDNSVAKSDGYLNRSGNIINSPNWYHSSYIPVNSGSTYTITKNYAGGVVSYCLYNSKKTLISCTEYGSYNELPNIIPNQDGFIRYTVRIYGNFYTRFSGISCTNGNQALDDSINGLNDSLNDSNVDSSDSTINNLKDKIPTNSVISDLLLLPVRFLQNFVNALGSSCSRFSLGSLYGTELFMPCINIENYLGSGIWTTIDLIISGLFVYKLRKKFIEIYENLTNLKNGGNEVD